MSDWRAWGSERRDAFEKSLSTEELVWKLNYYRKNLDEDFGIQELLQLEDIRAKVLIAQAINDQPEFLMDQIGIMRNSMNMPTIAEALQQIADHLEELCER